jgi:hypothetical protein
MTYEEVQNFISAPNIYAGVSADQVAALTVTNYVTNIGGVIYVGTFDLVPDLADLQLIPAPPPPDDSDDDGGSGNPDGSDQTQST